MIPDNDFTRENVRKAHERYLSAVANIVSGGLWDAERVRIAGEAAVAEQDAAAKVAASTPVPEPSKPKAKRRPKARARRASR